MQMRVVLPRERGFKRGLGGADENSRQVWFLLRGWLSEIDGKRKMKKRKRNGGRLKEQTNLINGCSDDFIIYVRRWVNSSLLISKIFL